MTNTNKPFMSAFALSAAALFVGACAKSGSGSSEPEAAPTATADPQVKCFGINSCKGEGVCAVKKPELGIDIACAGENDCKGKGWIPTALSECDTKGGENLGNI